MLSVGLVLAEIYKKKQLRIVSRLGGFGSIDWGLGIGIPTRHGARMFVHFVEAPETRTWAEGKAQRHRTGSNIKWVLSKSSCTIVPLEPPAVAVTHAGPKCGTRAKLEQTALPCELWTRHLS